MGRLIDADALKDKVKLILNGNTRMKAYAIYAEIETAQTVDAVPMVHGRWESMRIDGLNWAITCSNCHQVGFTGITTYCPNCGAKMDKREKDNE